MVGGWGQVWWVVGWLGKGVVGWLGLLVGEWRGGVIAVRVGGLVHRDGGVIGANWGWVSWSPGVVRWLGPRGG